jgi:hypothetical protein
VLVVPSNRRPDRLEIEPIDKDYSQVRLVVGVLDVTTPVVNFAWHETVSTSLAAWFRELDNDWRGWAATKRWSSMEGQLELNAIHDGLGTVTLTARLKDGSPERWIATGHLQLDAGVFLALSALAASSK